MIFSQEVDIQEMRGNNKYCLMMMMMHEQREEGGKEWGEKEGPSFSFFSFPFPRCSYNMIIIMERRRKKQSPTHATEQAVSILPMCMMMMMKIVVLVLSFVLQTCMYVCMYAKTQSFSFSFLTYSPRSLRHHHHHLASNCTTIHP